MSEESLRQFSLRTGRNVPCACVGIIDGCICDRGCACDCTCDDETIDKYRGDQNNRYNTERNAFLRSIDERVPKTTYKKWIESLEVNKKDNT